MVSTSLTSSSVILPSASLSTLRLFVLVNFIHTNKMEEMLNCRENYLHVKESLKPRIEALIGDLIPELFELSFIN